jgi:hypothetical protein
LMRCRNRDGQPVGARCKEVNVTVGAVISSTVTEPEPEREQTGKRRREDTPATAPKRARDRPLGRHLAARHTTGRRQNASHTGTSPPPRGRTCH